MLEKFKINRSISDPEYYNECNKLRNDYHQAVKSMNSYDGIDYFDKVNFYISRNTILI